MFPSRSLVHALRSLQLTVLRPYSPPHYRRHFSPSPQPKAAENPDSFIANIKNTTIFQKLADKPDALSALAQFAKLLQDQGIDVLSGKPPSTVQIFRLAANVEFREAAKRVATELQKAGIQINSQEAMAELMNLRKEMSSS